MANSARFIHIIILMILVPIPLILKTMTILEADNMFEMKSVSDTGISKTSSNDTLLEQENIELEKRLKCQFPPLRLQTPPGKR